MNKLILIGISVLSSTVHAAPSFEAGKVKSVVCSSCHGVDGNSPVATFPKISQQNQGYFIKQINDYKSGKRADPIMAGQVANLSTKDIEDLALYFSNQSINKGFADSKKIELGQQIYLGGIKDQKVAACIACHGPKGEGNRAARYPRIAGQHAAYNSIQLKKFKAGTRTNDANKMMRNIAKSMSDAEIEAVSSYIEGLY